MVPVSVPPTVAVRVVVSGASPVEGFAANETVRFEGGGVPETFTITESPLVTPLASLQFITYALAEVKLPVLCAPLRAVDVQVPGASFKKQLVAPDEVQVIVALVS